MGLAGPGGTCPAPGSFHRLLSSHGLAPTSPCRPLPPTAPATDDLPTTPPAPKNSLTVGPRQCRLTGPGGSLTRESAHSGATERAAGTPVRSLSSGTVLEKPRPADSEEGRALLRAPAFWAPPRPLLNQGLHQTSVHSILQVRMGSLRTPSCNPLGTLRSCL